MKVLNVKSIAPTQWVLSIIFITITLLSNINLEAVILSEISINASCGYNLAQHYGVKEQAAGYKVETGFHHGMTAGLMLELQITPAFAFRYEFNYVTKGSSEKITIKELDGEALIKPAVMNVKYGMDYIEFPMLFKLKTIEGNNFSISVIAGAAMALKVSGDYKLDGKLYFPVVDSFEVIIIKDKSRLKDINQFDYSLIYGGELDFKIKKQPLTLGYRFTIGWDYMNLPTYEAGGFEPVQLRNQSYALYLSVPLWAHK